MTAKPPSKANPSPKPDREEPPPYTGENPCRATSFKFSSVKAACRKGGVPQAKALMKSMVKKAKARGESVKCSSCHTNQKTYENKSNAVADLRAMLSK